MVMLALGAAVWAGTSASAGFDLGEDLELGRAVHAVEGGPIAAGVGAAILATFIFAAFTNPMRASQWLVWLAIAALAVTALAIVIAAVVDGDNDNRVGLAALPFVGAFFSAPCVAVSAVLKQAGHHPVPPAAGV
jgi:hypothetical protein